MTANINWLTDPTVFAVNRLDAHSDHVSYASSWEIAQEKTSLRQSLDGTWGFAWSKCPAVRPEHFWENGFDDSGFGTIQVPGHMELQGYGQIQYTNVLYPWDGHAGLEQGQIDWERTYVGSYVKTFDLEPGLLGKQVCISFQGVERAFYVWLNGHFVGYSEDSFTPSDFDLTPYIQETNNRLCVEVFQHSSASWLEDQDFFRFSGIFRSVFLYAKPRLHLEDLWLQAGLCQDNTTGTLKIRLKLSGENKNCRVHCRIDGRLDCDLELHPEGTYFFSQAFSFQNVKPWCHESPTLYHVVLTLLDENGEAMEFIPYDIGFRRFEIKDRLLLLNGQRIVFNGVNRHEWNPHTGRAIGEEDMRRAMEVFLRNNINAVRTCHYPNQTPWYHMCDRNGIYMIDETNLETHGSFQRNAESNLPGNKPEWLACVLDRAKSMFERDKNHTAILLWSCGNESYAGSDILAMADFFRAQDPSRVVHYEGVTSNRAYDSISDVETQMYTRPDRIREYLESDPKKPFLLCEYISTPFTGVACTSRTHPCTMMGWSETCALVSTCRAVSVGRTGEDCPMSRVSRHKIWSEASPTWHSNSPGSTRVSPFSLVSARSLMAMCRGTRALSPGVRLILQTAFSCRTGVATLLTRSRTYSWGTAIPSRFPVFRTVRKTFILSVSCLISNPE